MTQDEFIKIFEQCKRSAMNVVIWRFGNRSLAEDALQAAAVYILTRLERFKQITESYFIQLVVNNARMIKRAQTRQYMRVLPQGQGHQLEIVEEQELEKEKGRKYDPNSRPDEDNGTFE